MTYLVLFLVTVGLMLPIRARSYFEPAPRDIPVVKEMNGIHASDYEGFAEKWHLVTARYREDSKEMRMTYANEIAWKAMASLTPHYPDGAVFAKIGIMTEQDPSFTSSRTPSGAKRLQFMVRNQSRYADTDGWGYALFDADGNTFQDEPPSRKTVACAACHRIVPERDYVFSRPMFLRAPTGSRTSPLTFKRMRLNEAPPEFSAYLRHDFNMYYELTGEIQKTAFSGTLDEIVPSLLEKAKLERAPSTLYLDQAHFSLCYPVRKKTPGCSNFRIVIVSNGKRVRDAEVCR